jgi:hypothetical protein
VTGPPRDWDKEMAEIDKIIAKQPVGASQGAVTKAGGAAPVQRQAPESAPVVTSRRAVLTTWVSVLLGVMVAAGVVFAWPYAHTCGIPLYGYLAAAAGVMLVGLWAAVLSWKRRIALAHLTALLVTLTGAVILGKAVLDRSSYPGRPAAWSCSTSTPVAP